MVQQLSPGYYMILMSINTIILIPVMFSVGIFFQQSRQIQETIVRLKLLGKNELKILENVLTNCLQLENSKSEFDALPRIDLCQGYTLALKLFKLGLISSILYNIYLLNFLYDRLRLLTRIICISLAILFVLNLKNNTWMMDLFELTLILLAYSMIIGHYLTNSSQSH